MFKTARFLRYSKCSKTTIDYTKTFLTFTTQKANAFSHWTACVSAINAPQYKLAKSLVLILKSLTSNKYTMKDSFAFAEEIVEQDSEFFKGSLDADSLLSNIPLAETIGICTNPLFKYTERVEDLSKLALHQAIEEPYFIFNGKLYKHVY